MIRGVIPTSPQDHSWSLHSGRPAPNQDRAFRKLLRADEVLRLLNIRTASCYGAKSSERSKYYDPKRDSHRRAVQAVP